MSIKNNDINEHETEFKEINMHGPIHLEGLQGRHTPNNHGNF